MLKKVLIIGSGSMGSKYFNILKKQRSIMVKRYDINRERSEFSKFSNCLSWGPDFAIICTRNDQHISYLNKLINKIKLKRILVEKPLAINLGEIKKIENNINFKKNKKRIFVSCNMRFHPAIKKIKKFIKGTKDKIFYSEIFWCYRFDKNQKKKNYLRSESKGGGVIYDQWHEIDLLTYFFGKIDKTDIYKYTFEKKINKLSKILIKHNSGILSFVTGDYLRSLKERGMKIIFENFTLDWTSFGKNPERIQIKILKNDSIKNILRLNNNTRSQLVMYEEMLKNFLYDKKTKLLNWDQSKTILKLITNVKN